jgi:hypothetical protein
MDTMLGENEKDKNVVINALKIFSKNLNDAININLIDVDTLDHITSIENTYDSANIYLEKVKKLIEDIEQFINILNSIISFHNNIIKIIEYSETFIPKLNIIRDNVLENIEKINNIKIVLMLNFKGKNNDLIKTNISHSEQLLEEIKDEINELNNLQVENSINSFIDTLIF